MISITAKNFIDGGWQDPVDCFESLDPADVRETVGTAPRSTADDIDRAVSVATRTFARWRTVGAPKRADAIDSFAQVLKRYGKEVAKYLCRESGKLQAEATAEVQDALAIAQCAAGSARSPRGLVGVPDSPVDDVHAWLEPHGVVACLTPGYSPVALPLRHILPALAVGDTVVWKPSEHTPVCAQWLSRLFLEAGFLEGALNIVHGAGETVGAALSRHPGVSAVVFCGNRETAVDIQTALAGDLSRPLVLEPSAVSAAIVCDDANLETAAVAIASAALRNCGQTPDSVDRVFVAKSVQDDFVMRLSSKLEGLEVGPGLEPNVQLGPLVSADAHERYVDLRASCRGEVLYDGFAAIEPLVEHGWFAAPLVVRLSHSEYMAGPPDESRVPRILIVPVDDEAQATEAFNASAARSSLAIFTRNRNAERDVRERAAFKRGYVNLSTVCSQTQILTAGTAGSFGRGQGLTRMKTFTVGQTTAD